MLKPGDRRVLLEALRPPPGYRVDRAIAATYSLDLLALLVAPLSFSLFDRLASRADGSQPDPIGATALLQAVREHAEKLTVFCQAGAIAEPSRYRPILTYLEGSVVDVAAPGGGVFHPKVWVQRLTGEGPVLYRLLVGSRNLTFDRSWDTLLVLEGELKDRSKAFAVNHPLGDFVAALPGFAVRPVSAAVRKDIARLADEIRRVQFELPPGFTDFKFWPLGLDGKPTWPFEARIDRLLVVSPFVGAETLERLSSAGKGSILVSTPDALCALPSSGTGSFDEVMVLDEGAEIEPDDSVSADTAARGLHAKLYVADAGRSASIWTGSANATHAAFHLNVEMLVQLTGKKGDIGVDAVLGPEGGALSFRTLLVPFRPEGAVSAVDPVLEKLEQRLHRTTLALAARPWRAGISRHEGSPETYTVVLESKGAPPKLEPGLTLKCWPIALSAAHASDLVITPGGVSARFVGCSFQALTSFFAFSVLAEEEGARCEKVFTINVPLDGAPEDRGARVLLSMLDDRSKVLRFLRLLLALDPVAGMEEMLGLATDAPESPSAGSRGGEETPLLEALLRALDQDPSRIDELDRTIRELRAAPGGAALLPPDLDVIWEPIRAVWESRRPTGGQR